MGKLSAKARNKIGVIAFSKFINQSYRDHLDTLREFIATHTTFGLYRFIFRITCSINSFFGNIFSITLALINSQPYLAFSVFGVFLFAT